MLEHQTYEIAKPSVLPQNKFYKRPVQELTSSQVNQQKQQSPSSQIQHQESLTKEVQHKPSLKQTSLTQIKQLEQQPLSKQSQQPQVKQQQQPQPTKQPANKQVCISSTL